MILKKFFAAVVIVLTGACTAAPMDSGGDQIAMDFFNMDWTSSVRSERIQHYSTEQQFEIVSYGNTVIHPPAHYLITTFAKQGGSIVPLLTDKLQAATDESDIRIITEIFAEVSNLRLYDFSRDKPLLNLLRRRVGGMQGIWGQFTREKLSALESSR